MAAALSRPPPSTFEYLEAVALREPQRPALRENGAQWSYGLVYRYLVRLSRLLSARGIGRGQRVAVTRPSFHLQLLLMIACENLGAVTLACSQSGDPDLAAALALVDWVITPVPLERPAGTRELLIDADFVRTLEATDPADGLPCPRVALELHEPQRITRTSGSTGQSKFMLLSRAAQESWIQRSALMSSYHPGTRLMVTSPLVLNAVYARSSACLRIGAVVLAIGGRELAEVEVTDLWAMPLRLEEVLNELPPDFAPRKNVNISTLGGFLSPALRERCQRLFGPQQLINRYGANELGNICDDLDADGVGVLSPGVEVRIVDEDDNDLPAGATGLVVVRTPSMAEGYLNADADNTARFRSGWFHTRDWGTLVGPRRIRVSGRVDDLINLGGLKIPAVEVERQVRALLTVRDVCVMAINVEGATLGIALVLEPGEDKAQAMHKVQQELALGSTTGVWMLFLDALPRRAEGTKIDRAALQQAFRDAAAKASR